MIEENFDVEYEIERQEYEEQLQEKHLKSLPEFLFKYKALNTEESIKRTVDILQDHRIFMPNYEQLNDPLEGANARLLGIDQTVRDEIRKKWQILALSSDCFLPTLWAYYADNYTGENYSFCLLLKAASCADKTESEELKIIAKHTYREIFDKYKDFVEEEVNTEYEVWVMASLAASSLVLDKKDMHEKYEGIFFAKADQMMKSSYKEQKDKLIELLKVLF